MPENLNFKDLPGKDAPGPLYRELRGPSLEVRISHPFAKTMYPPHLLEMQSIFFVQRSMRTFKVTKASLYIEFYNPSNVFARVRLV